MGRCSVPIWIARQAQSHEEPRPAVIRLTLSLATVSLVIVPLFLGILVGWTLLMMVAGNGITGAPDWPFVLYLVYAPLLEWLCVSTVNGVVARKWFPHVRGGLLLAASIPVLVAILTAAVLLLSWAPVGNRWGVPGSMSAALPAWAGHPFPASGLASATAAFIWQAGPGVRPEMIKSTVLLLVFAIGGLTIISAGTTAVLLVLLRVLPGRKWRHRDVAVRLAAVQSHRERVVLRWVAANDKDAGVRQAAGAQLALL